MLMLKYNMPTNYSDDSSSESSNDEHEYKKMNKNVLHNLSQNETINVERKNVRFRNGLIKKVCPVYMMKPYWNGLIGG